MQKSLKIAPAANITRLPNKLVRAVSVLLIVVGVMSVEGHEGDSISSVEGESKMFLRDSSYESDKRAQSAFYDQTNPLSLFLVGLINIYQRAFSSQEGSATCQFRPSCSHFGALAVKKYGPLQGVLMSGDRQLRCNSWTQGKYPLWQDNLHLADPIEEHDLCSHDTLW
jgi:uncharacterized protein